MDATCDVPNQPTGSLAPSFSCLHAHDVDFGLFEECFGVPLGFLNSLGSKILIPLNLHIHNFDPYRYEFHINTKVILKTFHWTCGDKCRRRIFLDQ